MSKGKWNHTAVNDWLKQDVLDAKVMRRVFNGSELLAAVTRVRMREKWKFKGSGKKENERKEQTRDCLTVITCRFLTGI